MALIKILKNNSSNSKQVLKKQLADQETFTVNEELWLDAARNEDLIAAILDGSVIVNDGSSDLTPSEGVEHMQRFQFDSADKVSFDNTSNGFVSTDAQAAIEEVKTLITNSPVGALDVYCFFELGTATNKWLEYGNNSITSDEVTAILPFDADLIACTFSNENDDSDTDIEVNKASNGSTSNARIATFQVRCKRVARFSNFTAISLNAGDRIAVYVRDQGSNVKDVVVKLYFLVRAFNKENAGQEYNSDFSVGSGGITVT